jgi:DNA-binding NarL/FixJ family response regulator
MITVLLVDDHASVRTGLRYLLETEEDIEVVAASSNGVDALARVNSSCPDIAVVDISMLPMDGMETTRLLLERCRFLRVIVLSIHDHPEYVQRALEVGASGYVLKEAIGEDLLKAIRTVFQGERYFSRKIAEIASQFLPRKGDDSWAG